MNPQPLSTNKIKLDNHLTIMGGSGGGKRYFASWCMENLAVTPYVLFFNTSNELDVENNCDITVRNYDELEDFIMTHKKGKINYIVSKKIDIILEQIEEVETLLFAIGDKINKKSITQWITVFFDEVHLFAPKGAKYSSVDNFFTRGRRAGIVAIGISQRPALVSQTVLTQSYYYVYFRFNVYEDAYFSRYGIKMEEFKEWLDQPHNFIWVGQNGINKVKPVKLKK